MDKKVLLVVPFVLLVLSYPSLSQPLEIQHRLIYNTDQCLTDCELVFAVRVNRDITITKEQEFTHHVIYGLNSLNLTSYGFQLWNNASYEVAEPIYEYICNSTINYTSNGTAYNVTNCTNVLIGWNNYTQYYDQWTDFNPIGKTVKADRWYVVKFWGKRPARLGDNNIDVIPVLMGKELPYSWWNSSWTKRKVITLSFSDSYITTDFQINASVAYDSDMQSDFDDIRFVSNDNATELDYWLEKKTDSAEAYFWVEADDIPADVWMYYGNADAASNSDGRATFPELFDDFDDNSINTTIWDQKAGTCYETDALMYCPIGTWNFLCSDDNWYDENVSLTGNVQLILSGTTNEFFGIFNWTGMGGANYRYIAYYSQDSQASFMHRHVNDTYIHNLTGLADTNYWDVSVAFQTDGTTPKSYVFINGSLNTTLNAPWPIDRMAVCFSAQKHSVNVTWSAIRKFHYPESTVTFGAEEPEVVTDTCTCGTTGWYVDINDNCTLSADCIVAGDFNLTGTNGNFSLGGYNLTVTKFFFNATDGKFYIPSTSKLNVTG